MIRENKMTIEGRLEDLIDQFLYAVHDNEKRKALTAGQKSPKPIPT